MRAIAIPKRTFKIEQSGDWSAIDNETPIQITGDSTIDENLAYLFRIISNQQKVINELLQEMREAGYENT